MSDTPLCIYEFGPFRVDPLRRLLLRDGNALRLPTKAFEILLVLLEEKGRLVDKDELIQRVWPDAVVEDNNLTVNMSALRRSLCESPGEHRYVVTVPGRGYQFVADVRQYSGERASESEGDAPRADMDAQSLSPRSDLRTDPVPVAAQTNGVQRAISPPGVVDPHNLSTAEYIGGEIKRHRRGMLLLLAAVIATAVIVFYLADARYPRTSSTPNVSSIAVLPFAHRSDNPNAEYLSDGIAESLINSLSQLPGLKVIARSSSFKYKGKEDDIQEVARALGVEAILTGRVVQQGDGLTISVELVNTRDKTQLWGEQYNRKASDLPQVQEEISREIAERLRLRLSAGQQLASGSTVKPAAYELLLKGRFYWNKGGSEDRKKAVEFLNQAIAIDPNYAIAYAELANAYSILGNDGVIDSKEAVPKAEAAAVRALALDERLAEAHRALAYNKQLAWDWEGAEQAYKRAIGLNPNYSEGHASYSTFLGLMGRHEQAFAEAKRAKELDPFSFRINIWVYNTHFMGRRYDQALDVLRQMQELDPDHPLTKVYLAFIYTTMGRYPEATTAYKEMIKAGDNSASIQIYLGCAYAKARQREEARKILHELQNTKKYVSQTELAALYAGLGENDQAFQSLERGYEARDVQMMYIGVDPFLDSLRSDPRFTDLMRRVGLPQ